MYTDENIISEIKNGWYEGLRFLGRSSNVEIIDKHGIKLIVSDVPWGIHNAVFATDMGILTAEIAEEVKNLFVSRKRPVFYWWIPADTSADSLGATLEPLGFSYSQGPPGMALTMEGIRSEGEPPDRMRVEEVKGGDALESWCRVVAQCHGSHLLHPMDLGGWMYQLHSDLDLAFPIKSFLGTIGQQPVAASQYFLRGKVAVILWVSTLAEFRGRGIGSAITNAAVQDARSAGCSLAVLHATKLGYNVYKRLGFREYCNMELYRYPAAK